MTKKKTASKKRPKRPETTIVRHVLGGNCTVHLGDGRRVRFDEATREVPAELGAELVRAGVCLAAQGSDQTTNPEDPAE